MEEKNLIPYEAGSLPEDPWVVFSPHPDDETLGIGGILKKGTSLGRDIFVVFITTGEKQGDPSVRISEAEKALQILGIKRDNIVFWSYPDRGLLECSKQLSRDVEFFLKKINPKAVFVTSPMEYHPDHRVASKIIFYAAQRIGVPKVCFYEVLRESECNCIIPLNQEEMEAKLRAIECYKSQSGFGYKEYIVSLNRLRSLTLKNTQFAEGLYISEGSIPPIFLNYWKDIAFPVTEPLISIILRTKNRPHLLKEALSSVASQGYPRLEIVVVNDGGIDVSNLLSDFETCFENCKYLFYEKTKGRSAAANLGLKNASGEWILLLDDDDLLESDALYSLWKAAHLRDKLVCYGNTKAISLQTGELIRRYGEPFSRSKLLFENYIPTGSFIVFKDLLLEKKIFFDEDLDLLEDWDFLIRLAQHVDFHYEDVDVLLYRLQEGSFTVSSEKQRFLWMRIYEKHRGKFKPEVLTEIFDVKTRERLKLEDTVKDLKAKLNSLEAKISAQRDFNERLSSEVDRLKKNLSDSEKIISDLKEENSNLKKEVLSLEQELCEIKSSTWWRLATKYRNVIQKALPENTKRKKIYDLIIKGVNNFLTYGLKDTLIKSIRYIKKTQIPIENISTHDFEFKRDFEFIEFNPVSNPEVTIIIPFYNKKIITFNCLYYLKKNTPDGMYEVILINDASTENLDDFKKNIQGVKFIENKVNYGFVKSCNRGAQEAKGKYLVFLNNDTAVQKGWLEALLSPFRENKSVGLVGAKLIYPDGKLQEAGSIIWSNADGYNYGKYDDPNKPQYSYMREVDYCSGACICVPKKLFDDVGKFDERFSPAYYEDTDLAFKIRAAGFKVVYQPFSVVCHLEGATCGRSINSGVKKYQEVNKVKFLEKWKEILDNEHFEPSEELLFLARERPKRGIILVADHYVPTWDKDSGSYRMYNLLKIMVELNYKVIFWPDNLAPLQPYTQELQKMGIEVIYGSDFSFADYVAKNHEFINLIWACRATFAPKYLKEAGKYGIKTVFDTIDLHFLRERRRAEVSGSESIKAESERLKMIELTWAKKSDLTIVVSEDEKQILEKEGVENVKVIPNIHHVVETASNFEDREGLMFIGSFQHPPNEDAVLWFVDEIFPLIKERIGDIRFYVVGSSPTSKIKKLNSSEIIVTGYVQDVSLYFNKSKVFVAPLRYGAGLKGKVGQAMSYGLPTVTTSIGAEGFVREKELPFIVRDDPEGFAAAVVELYTNKPLWERLSVLSKNYIKRYFSYEVVKKSVEETLSSLIPVSPWEDARTRR